jgi:hypothetical protein
VRLSGAFDHRVHIFSLGFLRRFSFPQMLKAIWPSIAHLPNHLPPSANITTTGTSTGPGLFLHSRRLLYRDDLLLSLLAYSTPFYVRLTAEDTLVVFGQSNHSTTDMAGFTYLGVRQSAPRQWDPCTKG